MEIDIQCQINLIKRIPFQRPLHRREVPRQKWLNEFLAFLCPDLLDHISSQG